MAINDALICAYAFDGLGRAVAIDGLALESRTTDAGWLWIHLDRAEQETEHWLRDSAGLEPLVIEALLEEETRPRCVSIGDGLLVILRGVNLNVGGIPGTENNWAFTIVCIILVVLAAAVLWLFRRFRIL